MRKKHEIARSDSCWNKATDDEILFVLLERDAAAPETIRFWARKRIELGLNKPDDIQIRNAMQTAMMIETSLSAHIVTYHEASVDHNSPPREDPLSPKWVAGEGIAQLRLRQNRASHTLYKTGDTDAPACIKDQNGDIVLGMCRNCGRAESELSEPCSKNAAR